MARETTDMITTPKLRIYGVGDLNRLLPFEYKGKIGKEITDFNEPYEELKDGSIILRDQATLFQAYVLSLTRGLDLPEDFRRVLHYLFDNEAGRGNVTDDSCDYNRGDKGMGKANETDRRVLWKAGDSEFPILVPKTDWVKCTNDGLYRPDTGTPFETGSKSEALQSMVDHGIPSNVAKKILSYWRSRGEGSGTSYVDRSSIGGGGPFAINVDARPTSKYRYIGRFPAE